VTAPSKISGSRTHASTCGELHRLLAQLEEGELEKVVLTQRNQMRAVLVTLERYSELERRAASA
jgi:PHD/YefM family antitoxin component YafN of YafNO toxin-antitoxin module